MNTRTQRTLAPLFIALAVLTLATAFLMPQKAHACGSEVTWQYNYTLQPNPFPPNTPGYAAFSFLYGQNQVTQSEYQYATIGDSDGVDCLEDTSGTPSVSIIAVPSAVNSGESSQLSWVSTNTTSCVGTNFNAEGYTAGNAIVTPSTVTVYSVTCTNAYDQSATASATVTVNPSGAPAVSLTATPSSIILGESSVLAWTSSDAASCALDQGIGSVSPNSAGQRTVSPSSTLTYSITCYGAGSSTTVTNTTPPTGSGTWAYIQSDISDFACPLTDLNKAYTSTPNCPSSPQGKSCVPGSICKVNTASACNINTDLYTCTGGTSPTSAFTLQGGMQCSGGTHVASWNDTQDGVGFTQGTGTMNAECDAITPAGGCCQVEVRELVGPTGQPVNTYYTGKAYTGATLVQKDSYSAPSGGGNTNNYNFFAGLKGAAPAGECGGELLTGINCQAGEPTFTQCAVGERAVPNSAETTRSCSTYGHAGNAYYGYQYTGQFGGSCVPDASCTGGGTTTTTTTTVTPGASASAYATVTVTDVVDPTECVPNLGAVCTSAPNMCSQTNAGTIACNGSCTASTPSNASCPGGGTDPNNPGGPGTNPGGPGVTPGTSSLSALLTAFPVTVVRGETAVLSWISAHAVSCTGGNFSTANRTSGTKDVTPLDTTLYTLTCADSAGNNAFSTATVTVVAPTLMITGTPQLVRSGDSTTISWSVLGRVSSCNVTGPGLNSSATSGSQRVVVTSESTYTLSCVAGSFRPSVGTTVRVLPSFKEF